MNLNKKHTILTMASSYVAQGTSMAVALITIRLASRALDQEEFGLWNFCASTIGYILLLDLGVSASLGRLFGEPLSHRDEKELGRWFTLALGVLAFQAALMFAGGWFVRDSVISWFDIPDKLRTTAGQLWMLLLLSQVLALPFRAFSALLNAKNLSYFPTAISVLFSLLGLGVFWWCLASGRGPLSYGYASLVTSLGAGLLNAALALKMEGRLRLRLDGLRPAYLREIFGYASGVFAVGIAVQVVFSSQALIVTKLMGLEYAAIMSVTSRIPVLLMQFCWKPFDSFTPRWQVMFCGNSIDKVRTEFTFIFRITMLIAALAFIGITLVCPPFIRWWTKPEYYGGWLLNTGMAGFLVVQTVMHCFSHPFYLFKKMKTYSAITYAAVALEMLFYIAGVAAIGMAGIPFGSIAASALLIFPYLCRIGGSLLGLNSPQLMGKDLPFWIGSCLVAVAASHQLQPEVTAEASLLEIIGTGGIASILGTVPAWRAWTIWRDRNLEKITRDRGEP